MERPISSSIAAQFHNRFSGRKIWFVVLWALMAIAFFAVLIRASFFDSLPPSSAAQAFDAEQFKTIPPGVIISDIAFEYDTRLFIEEMAEHRSFRDAYLAALAKIDPEDPRREIFAHARV